jgi:regulatory protein
MALEPVLQPQTPKKTKKPSPQAPTLRGRALRLLGRREFARQELEKRLRAYSETPVELEALLDDLAAHGWLSDARYADALVRKRTGQFARRAIAQKLKQAGVAVEVTDAALAQADPEVEFAAALALCRRKFRSAPIDPKAMARQIRFLQSRGFALSLALRVLKQSSKADEVTGES